MDRLPAKITTINQKTRIRSVCYIALNDLALEYGKEYFVESKTVSLRFFIRMIGNSDSIGPDGFNDIIYVHIYTDVFAGGMIIYEYGFYMTLSNYSITNLKWQWTFDPQFTKSLNVPSVALRFQNVYGPGQSLNNPYTGILSIFCTRIMARNPVLIYEDGQEKRDFVYIEDVVESIRLVLKKGFSGFDVYNVGMGSGTPVLEVANILAEEFKTDVPVQVVGKYRIGDIRHAWGDIRKIQEEFGYKPKISVREGLKRFIAWVKEQPKPEDRYEVMEKEMVERGLLGKAP
jgi:dTDP-D-glucose 4,6-dehydratase